MKQFIRILALVFTAALVSACQPPPAKPKKKEMALQKPVTLTNKEKDKKMTESEAAYQYRGTVRFYQLEGGFFGITTEQGKKFLPMQVSDPSVLKDGAVIEFSGEKVEDMMTIQQWGTPFKITKVRLISEGKDNSAKSVF